MGKFYDIFYAFLSPWRYLCIRDSTRTKWIIDLGIPAVIGILSAAVLKSMNIQLLGPTGILSSINGVIQILPGFFIAAIAAVTTFPNEKCDEEMPGPVCVKVKIFYKKNSIHLTRRRFLCMMFSFLSAQSLFFAVAIAILNAFYPQINTLKFICPTPWIFWAIKTLLAFCSFFVLAQIITVTLWGLYYLGEKMHNRE